MEETKKKKFPFKPRIDGLIYHAVAFLIDKDIPDDKIDNIVRIAVFLEKAGFTPRVLNGKTGDAIRAALPKNRVEQIAPWEGFDDSEDIFSSATNHAKAIAMEYQPGLSENKPVIWGIVGCQVNLILGKDVRSAATMVVSWTPCGSESWDSPSLHRFSPVKMGLKIAYAIESPVFSAGNPESLVKLKEFASKYYKEYERGKWERSLFDYTPPKK